VGAAPIFPFVGKGGRCPDIPFCGEMAVKPSYINLIYLVIYLCLMTVSASENSVGHHVSDECISHIGSKLS